MPMTKQAMDNTAMLGLRPERLAIMERMLTQYAEEGKRQAIVVKANRYGSTIFEGCYGTNTKEGGVRMDTIFPVASITKPVIATLIMMLQEDGLLDVTDPVKRYLPVFDGNGKEKICLWHFLTHTSGYKEEEVEKFMDDYIVNTLGMKLLDDNATHEEWEAHRKEIAVKLEVDPNENHAVWNKLTMLAPLLHEPHTLNSYNNFGYQMLKEIITTVTGESIDAFAKRALFDPMGMCDTYWMLPEEKWPRTLGRGEKCVGYPWINSKDNNHNESGSGGMKSTAIDIVRFGEMFRNEGVYHGKRILSKATVRAMSYDHNPKLPTRTDFDAWGLGWNYHADKKDDTGVLRSSQALDHGGWAGTKIMIDVPYGIVMAIFSAEYEGVDFNVYGRAVNMLYAALE